MSGFRLQIVTPDGSLFDGEAEALRVRTTEGYVSIRRGHADYLALRILLMDPDLTDIVVLREEGEAMSFGDGIQKDGGQDVLEVISQGMPGEAKYLEGVGWNER